MSNTAEEKKQCNWFNEYQEVDNYLFDVLKDIPELNGQVVSENTIKLIKHVAKKHTRQRLTTVKEKVIALKDKDLEKSETVDETTGYLKALRDAKTLIEEELK